MKVAVKKRLKMSTKSLGSTFFCLGISTAKFIAIRP